MEDSFYKKAKSLDGLKAVSKPTNEEFKELLAITKVDCELGVYFYKDNKNGGWVGLLKEAGEFEELESEDVTRLGQMKARYLLEVAEQEQKEVLDIISTVEARDAFVQSRFLDVILKEPVEYVNEGTMLIKKYMDGRNYKHWHFVGEPSAKFMAAIAEVDIDKAFDVAKILLEVWKREKKEVLSKDIEAKFKAHEYKDLVFKYYKKMWEADGIRAGKQLAGIFDNYLKELGEDDYAVQRGFYIKLERLDQIGEKFKRDIIAIIVGGICESGRNIIEKQADKVDELLDYLNGLDKPIFERIVMHLLRFVTEGTHKKRISSIIGNRKFLELPYWKYEYRLLLRDKYEDVDDKAIQVFKNWVEEQIVDEEEKKSISSWFKEREEREATEKDFEQIENNRKARELYLVKEKFPELYENYKEKSGASDLDLMPKPRISTGRRIGPTEGSPISVEEMLKMEPQGVVEYLADSSRWEIDKKKESFFHTPEEGLEGTFEKVVQQRVNDYAELSTGELNKLKPIFLKSFFHGAWNALREKQVKEETLVKILQRANYIIAEKKDNEDYEGVYRSIIYVVEGIFEDEPLRKKLIKPEGELIWGIIETLSRYEDKRDETERDEDPHQRSINCVAGEAFTLVLRFGLSYKNEDSKTYEKEWSGKIRSVLGYVVDNVKDARIRSVLGVWFPQLHWLEKKWVETNLDKIFNDGDDNAWDVVWGTYMSWGRTYKDVFHLLVEHGKYDYAVEKIESGIYSKHDKNPDEGLVEQLMVGFFNKWIGFDEPVLTRFFQKAPTKLRGHAAHFLTTGFKSIIEEPKKDIIEQLKYYWENRLGEITKEHEENIEEAFEFVGWVKNSPFKPKETFELLYKTLELTNGKIGERNIDEFIEGVCDIAEQNELMALRCLNKAMSDEQMEMYFSPYEKNLTNFMDSIVRLPDNYENIDEIRKEAIKLADAYGRKHIYNFRDVYDKLSCTV